MIANIPYIEKKFKEFNQLIFAGQLPMVPIELSNAKTFLGKCVYQKRKGKDGRVEHFGFRLRFNTRIDLPEQELEDTIIHEMIHYYIYWKQMDDTSAHGTLFQHVMNSINRKYGRHVTIRHEATEEQKAQAIDNRERWHVVAVVHLSDGQKGVKVLPRIMQKVINYHDTVLSSPDVTHIDLYMTHNPFFNRYPTSAALKIYKVEETDLKTHLAEALPLTIQGNEIVVANTL